MRIGVDVGGTNTDAALVDGRDVLAEAKTPTTPDVTGGITAAVRALVDSYGLAVADVQAVMIGGEVDKVVALEGRAREDALEEAKAEAAEKAVAAGAVRDSVHVVDVEDVPIAYLPGNATRIRVKAVGELDLERMRVAAGR
jgi:N-methylhydantoinase A/oxoprolinase/acetone carboxylase beta subunit